MPTRFIFIFTSELIKFYCELSQISTIGTEHASKVLNFYHDPIFMEFRNEYKNNCFKFFNFNINWMSI